MDQDIRGEVLHLVFKNLGIKPSIATFEDRARLQKLVFIVQKMGVPLNFSYNWYLAGPYSPELTPFYFDIAANEEAYDTRTREKLFAPKIQSILDKVRKVMGGDLGNLQLLVAIASILYWMPFKTEDVRNLKPALSEEIWRQAEEKLRVLGLT